MRNNKKIITILFSFVLILLAGCGDTSDTTGDVSEDLANEGVTEKNQGEDNNKENNEEKSNEETSLKKEYLAKLEETKKAADALEPTDSSTYALKKVENDRWELWDNLLNEIYGVLKEQLSSEEMNQLKEEQRNWITYRDSTAKKASLKFEGGTAEQLEYVAVLANLTEERCYELVSKYMK